MRTLNLLAALICCCSLGTSLMAQQTTFGVKAGVNIAHVVNPDVLSISDDGTRVELQEKAKVKPRHQLGVWLNVPLSKRFSLQPELLWTEKVWHPTSVDAPGVTKDEIVFDYLSLPLMFTYKINRWQIELGPEASFLADCWYKWDPSLPSSSPDFIDKKQIELALNIGVQYQINRWQLGLRYNKDLTPFLETTYTDANGIATGTGRYFHHGMQLSLGYKLF